MLQAVGLPQGYWHSALSGQWLLSENKRGDVTLAQLFYCKAYSTGGFFFCNMVCHPTPEPSEYDFTSASSLYWELHNKVKTGSGNSFQRWFQGRKDTVRKSHTPKHPVFTYCYLPLVCLASFVVEIWGWVKKRQLGRKWIFSSHAHPVRAFCRGSVVKGYMSNTPRWWHPRCIHNTSPWHHDWKRRQVRFSLTHSHIVYISL